VAHLPELRGAASPFGAIETVTIRRMLSHESGLTSEPPGTDWALPAYEGRVDRSLARVAEIGTRIPPNTQPKYSNLAYQLLGEIVGRTSGKPYVEYVRAAILDPLGMSASGFEPLPEALLTRCATGYAGRFLSDELKPAVTPPTVWAEGGLWSCVEDLARWLSFQLREDGGPRKDAQVLAGPTLKEMHTARYLGNDEWTEAWCISWYSVRRGDVINGIGDAPGLSMDLATIARDAVRATAPSIEAPPSLPEAYRPLLGIYADRDSGTVSRLEWRDGKLVFIDADQPTWRPTITPTDDPDVFVVEPGFRESGEQVRFRRLPDGRVAAVFLAAFTLIRLDAVVAPD
jgi:hypothetical protein